MSLIITMTRRGAQETPESAKPELHDRDATPSLLVDVRPALDGAVAVSFAGLSNALQDHEQPNHL